MSNNLLLIIYSLLLIISSLFHHYCARDSTRAGSSYVQCTVGLKEVGVNKISILNTLFLASLLKSFDGKNHTASYAKCASAQPHLFSTVALVHIVLSSSYPLPQLQHRFVFSIIYRVEGQSNISNYGASLILMFCLLMIWISGLQMEYGITVETTFAVES